MTRTEARTALERLVVGIREPDEDQAVSRLLERIATAPPELRDALLETGARALLGRDSAATAVRTIAAGDCETLGAAESLCTRALAQGGA